MWTKVNVGFKVEDETANFGTRACAVNSEAVYETNTLAEIHADETPTRKPKVNGKFLQCVGLCVTVDSCLTIFSKDYSTVNCVITFPSDIEAFTVTPCGSFVVVGQCGQLKCFHIPSQDCPVFSTNICPLPDYVHIVSIDCYENGSQVVIILVLNNWRVLRTRPIDFVKVHESILRKEESEWQELVKDISFHRVPSAFTKESQVTLQYSQLKCQSSIVFGSAEMLCTINNNDQIEDLVEVPEPFKMVRIGGILDSSTLLVLCDNGSIMHVCLHNMCVLSVLDEYHVKDFVVLEGSSSLDNSLLLLVEEPDQQSLSLMLLSWPDYKIKYKIPVADSTFLIQQEDTEDTLFLEGFGTEEIETIRVKAVTESQPDLRLDRILQRYKFEEAEKFAEMFKLDLDIVYKSHVRKLSVDLDPWGPQKENPEEIFNTILQLIKKIKDHQFVAEICVSVALPNFDMVHTMLTYGMERFSKLTDKKNKALNHLLDKVSTISRRLDTCMLIYGSEITINTWIEFPKYDLILACTAHLKRGEINKAILIWSRHFSDIKTILNMDQASKLLTSVSKSVPVEDLMRWFRHFVPQVLMLFPDMLLNIIEWTIQRAKGLEVMDKGNWPDSGLSLARCLLDIAHMPHAKATVLTVFKENEVLSAQSALNSLLDFINKLDNVKTLKDVYNVSIPYDMLVEDDHASFVIAILDKIPLDKIDQFMNEFYHRLMKERGLDPDIQILQFVQEILINCENYWFWNEAPWEVRVLALIPHINNIEVKLDTILHVLKSAPVPWTAAVSQLAYSALLLPHKKANDIKSEWKDVPLRLIIKKYGCTMTQIKNLRQLVMIMVKKNPNGMLEDIEQLLESSDTDPAIIYMTALLHILRKGDESLAQEVMKNAMKKCPDDLLLHLLKWLNNCVHYNEWSQVSTLLRIMPQQKKSENIVFLSKLKNVLCLKMEFGVATTVDKLCVLDLKESILDNYSKNAAKDIVADPLKKESALKNVLRLAHLVQLTAEEGVMCLAKHCTHHSFQLALSLASEIEDWDSKPPRVYKKMQNLMCLFTSVYKPTESDTLLIEMFSTTIQKLSRHCLQFCCDEDIESTLRFGWLFRLPAKSSLGLYRDPVYNASTLILAHTSARTTINLHISGVLSMFTKELLQDTTPTLPESMQNEITNIMPVWKRLKEEQQELTCIRLVFDYCWAHRKIDVLFKEDNDIRHFLCICVKDVLKKLFRLRNFDVGFALSLIHFFSKEEAINLLVEEAKIAGYHYQRLASISQLALHYSSMHNIQSYSKDFRKHEIVCKWAKKLNDLGLPFKDAYKHNESDHKQLMHKLISLPTTTVALLEEFCQDMVYDQQECLVMFLEHSLLNWEPQLEIKVNSFGEEEAVVKNEYSDLLNQSKEILNHLGSSTGRSMSWSEPIQDHLINLWNRVNCYYYEVFSTLTIIYQMVLTQQSVTEHIKRYQDILRFLNTYKRISKPSESHEEEQWFQKFPNKSQLPQISKFRLPFTPFSSNEVWKIIKPELSLKTYKTWLNIVSQLGIEPNMLCAVTIQRMSGNQLGGGARTRSGWDLQTCNSSVLQEVQECVSRIQSQEMASATLYYVVNHMPPGTDQKAAAVLCYSQAEQWYSKDRRENARTCFLKVEKKYLTICTSHILHSAGLGRPEYLELVLQPQDLIMALYNDPSIVQHLSHCPDINSTVMAIGELHGVKVAAIQQELLGEWLCPPEQQPLDISCDDMTQNFLALQHNTPTTTDNESIDRACYLLKSMDMETAARYLISHAGLREDAESKPTSLRLRALQCLCNIATAEIVERVTSTNLSTIKKNVQYLRLMNELEKMGLVWSLKGFESCDKEDVVRILLLKRSPHAVQVAGAMGLIFGLTNIDYWNQILQLCISFTLLEELSVLLPELTLFSHLLDHQTFTRAWNCVLLTPFQKAVLPLTEEVGMQLQSRLEMLNCCPVLRQLDLELLAQQCERLGHQDWLSTVQPFLRLCESLAT